MHDEHVRAKAIELRGRGLSIDEIGERLALSRATVFSWVKDLPLGRERRWSIGQRRGNEAMRRKYKALRDDAHAQGVASFTLLAREPAFRDFVCLYLAEGSTRDRNRVAICNSDPAVMVLATQMMRRFSRNAFRYSVQVHADQDLDAIRELWGGLLDVPPDEIRLQRKSNSGRLSGRSWRSVYGVLRVEVNDTMFKSRLDGWIEQLQRSWA